MPKGSRPVLRTNADLARRVAKLADALGKAAARMPHGAVRQAFEEIGKAQRALAGSLGAAFPPPGR